MQVKVLQERGIVRSTKFIDLLTLPLRLTEIGPKVKVSVNVIYISIFYESLSSVDTSVFEKCVTLLEALYIFSQVNI